MWLMKIIIFCLMSFVVLWIIFVIVMDLKLWRFVCKIWNISVELKYIGVNKINECLGWLMFYSCWMEILEIILRIILMSGEKIVMRSWFCLFCFLYVG